MTDEQSRELTTTETREEQPSLGDRAAELYGDEYHGVVPAERREAEEFSRNFAALTAQAKETAKQKLSGQSSESSNQATETTSDGARWSDEDVRVLAAYQNQDQQLRANIQQYQQARNAELQKLQQAQQNGDKARVEQIRRDIEQADQTLQQRWQQHVEQGQQIERAAVARKLQSEYQKMIEAEPELAKPEVRTAVRDFLVSHYGFTRSEAEGAGDARTVLMAYRNWKAAQPTEQPQTPQTVKTRKRKPKPQRGEQQVERARERLRESGKLDDALEVITARREAAQ